MDGITLTTEKTLDADRETAGEKASQPGAGSRKPIDWITWTRNGIAFYRYVRARAHKGEFEVIHTDDRGYVRVIRVPTTVKCDNGKIATLACHDCGGTLFWQSVHESATWRCYDCRPEIIYNPVKYREKEGQGVLV